ncbi:CYFA0S06e01244g1_1 [Cyberlindnera fabianii]|uniref:CYFA0S06e01244g1_1 n=1 Tax=Cyberlindnera fabianii TaxID=36022 RepID=A0A061AV81_CYBFA|nr:CYFA0S06e01244g1_1 [Cyberlindnera fabianii]
MAHPKFDDDVADTNRGDSSVYLQIATPKSPNSDGFSPAHFEETPLEREIKQNLCNEIDLEILLKHREYNLVRNEIERVQSQMAMMENLHDDPKYASYIENLIKLKKSALNPDNVNSPYSTNPNTPLDSPGAQNAANPYYNLRKTSTNHEAPVHRTSYGGLRPVVDAHGNKICVHKRSDGVIVRIDCPQCGRTDFGSAQGFLNHARLAHAVEYKSQEDAALQCGTVMPESEQDEIGTSSVKKLKELGMDADKCLCPGVCIEDPSKKRRRLSMKSDGNGGSTAKVTHLEKLYKDKTSTQTDAFKALVEDVTFREEVEDDDQSENTDEEQKKQISAFKKGHNRRKSRGGLSAVTFDDKVETFKEVSPGDTSVTAQVLSVETETPPGSAGSFTSTASSGYFKLSEVNLTDKSLTPSQRRRVPTVAEPLRTRSRSSRENSH